MGTYLFKYAELKLPPYFTFLDGLYSKISVISRSYLIHRDGKVINWDSETYLKYNDIYKQYQYKELLNDK